MSIAYKGSGVASVTYKGTDIKKIKKDGNYIWAKVLSINLTKASSVKTFKYTRTSTFEPSAGTTRQTDGSYLDNTVIYSNVIVGNTAYAYYGDVYNLTGTANIGYRFLPFSNGNLLWDMTGQVDNTTAFTAPSITYTMTRSLNTYYVTLNITNSNSIAVTAHISIIMGSTYNATKNIPANTTSTYTESMYSATVCVSAENSVYFTYGEDKSQTTTVTSYVELLSPIVVQTNTGVRDSSALIYNPNDYPVSCVYSLSAEGFVDDVFTITSSNSTTTTIDSWGTISVMKGCSSDAAQTNKSFFATFSDSHQTVTDMDSVDLDETSSVATPTMVCDYSGDIFGSGSYDFTITNNSSYPIKVISKSDASSLDSSADTYSAALVLAPGEEGIIEYDYSGLQVEGFSIDFYIGSNSNYYRNSVLTFSENSRTIT